MLDILMSTYCKSSIIVTTEKIKAIKQQKNPDTVNQQSPCSCCVLSWRKMTTQPCFNSTVGGNKSVNLQHLYRMCRKHVEEEGRRGNWVGRRKRRKTVVIKAERWCKCRRMQVVPVVLDEVLFSCWATKLFIYNTLSAYGHGRENCYTNCSFS